MAATAFARLNFRVPVETERRLRAAAEAAHETLTEFVLGPAQARAEEMLSAKTVVPAEYSTGSCRPWMSHLSRCPYWPKRHERRAGSCNAE